MNSGPASAEQDLASDGRTPNRAVHALDGEIGSKNCATPSVSSGIGRRAVLARKLNPLCKCRLNPQGRIRSPLRPHAPRTGSWSTHSEPGTTKRSIVCLPGTSLLFTGSVSRCVATPRTPKTSSRIRYSLQHVAFGSFEEGHRCPLGCALSLATSASSGDALRERCRSSSISRIAWLPSQKSAIRHRSQMKRP